ncbi:hypothetical protein RF11_03547 [Thelohanellus kitauei]|uniref:DDE-1 domain-containing protein n=1 Tax=Thelohanellus kitauei TaxID=669202 RepID=A0A0C2JYJ6_THEKT|nr:hypothetical protein RF11_03547 [Thelohanellus kitauei]
MYRITVLCCTNMSGTGKRKLLIIEKSASTRFFKEPRMEGLPVEYHANKNAKILLVVDNSAAHTHLDNLQNIGLEFLPRNTTSLVQTMDMGHEENEDMLPVLIINYEEFSKIYNNLPCYDNNENWEDLIVEDDDDDESLVPSTNH